MSSKKLQQEIIIWRDAWSGHDSPVEPNDVEFGQYLVSTGFLVKEDAKEIVIATQMVATPDDSRVRHLQGIVKKNIVARHSKPVRVPNPRS